MDNRCVASEDSLNAETRPMKEKSRFVVGFLGLLLAANSACVADKKLLFARPYVLGAARVRENWFSGSPSIARPYQGQARASTPLFAAIFARARVSPAGFGREECRGAGVEPRPPSPRA